MKQQSKHPQPPVHLRPKTREWWREVVESYELEAHHERLLTLAAESWDRCEEAREAILRDGAYVKNRFGVLVAHPGIGVERDNKIAFARLLRELDLDVDPPATAKRPPMLGRYAGGRNA